MSILTTALLGAAATTGGIGIYRTVDNRVPNGGSSNQLSTSSNSQSAGGEKKEKKSSKGISPLGSTAISSAALISTGSANMIYSKHRVQKIKEEWSTSVVESMSDEELIEALQETGLLEGTLTPEEIISRTK